MANKIWHSVNISTEEQNIIISPAEMFDGIIVETQEIDGTGSPKMYLNEDEMEFLIIKMREMMNYTRTK